LCTWTTAGSTDQSFNIEKIRKSIAIVPKLLPAAVFQIRWRQMSIHHPVGFISLFGVAVMSGVPFISQMTYQRRELGLPLKEAAIEGARIQLRQGVWYIKSAVRQLIAKTSIWHGCCQVLLRGLTDDQGFRRLPFFLQIRRRM